MANSRLVLSTDKDGLGLLNLDTLVTGDNVSLSKWQEGGTVPQALTNRNATGFPVICGYGHFGSPTEAFVLRPYLVP